MTHQRITFEWRVGESDFDFWGDKQTIPGLDTDTLPPEAVGTDREQQLVNYIARILALLVVVVVAAAGLSHSPLQVEWERAEAGILTSIDRENRAWYSLDRQAYQATIDPEISAQWSAEWRRHWRGEPGNRLEYSTELRSVELLDGGLVRVNVATRQPAVEWSQIENLQETRYYRETPTGWVRTVPGAYSEYWGEQRGVQLGALRFIYYERDEEAVRYAAPIVAQAIEELYRLLDFQAPVGYEEFTIELLPDRMGRWAWTGNHLVMTSPALSTLPDGLTHGEYLADGLFSRLSYRIFHEALEPGGRYLFRWTVMNWGLRRWMNSHLIEHPSPWYEQAVPILRSESADRLPLSPLDVSDSDQLGRPTRDYVIWRFLAAETLVDYGVSTYGEVTLPALIRAFAGAGSWSELTETVYGVDYDSFVAGWNEFLVTEYGLE